MTESEFRGKMPFMSFIKHSYLLSVHLLSKYGSACAGRGNSTATKYVKASENACKIYGIEKSRF